MTTQHKRKCSLGQGWESLYLHNLQPVAVRQGRLFLALLTWPSVPRSGTFEISEASGVRTGTKITLHLKEDCKEFATEERVKGE